MRRVLWIFAAVILLVPVWYSVQVSRNKGHGRKLLPSFRDLFTSESVRSAERAREARLLSEQSVALEKCRQAIKASTDALGEIDRWEKRVEGLLGSDEGRAVSADRRFVRGFAELYRRSRTGRPAITSTLSIARVIATDLERGARGEAGFVPDFGQMLEVEKGAALAEKARAEYRDDSERLEALLRSAERRPARDAVLLQVALQQEVAARSR